MAGQNTVNAAESSQPDVGERRRHPRLHVICGHLEQMVHGQHAEHLLRQTPTLSGAVTPLPVWEWVEPGMDLGRKGEDPETGGQLLLPIRRVWDQGPVVVLPPGRHTLSWTGDGLGRSVSDDVTMFTKQTATVDETAAELRSVVDRGHHAMWTLLMMLEPFVESECRKAAASLGFQLDELAQSDDNFGLSGNDVVLRGVVDRVMLGDNNNNDSGESPAQTVLRRSVQPHRSQRTDLMRYIITSLRRDAHEAVRQYAGDPRLGANVRKVAAEMGITTPVGDDDLRRLHTEYRRRFPHHKLGRRRLAAALDPQVERLRPMVSLDNTTWTTGPRATRYDRAG